MKDDLFIKTLLIIIVTLLALNIILPTLSNPPTSYAEKNIEYKIVDYREAEVPGKIESIEKLFNEYAKKGWEYIGYIGACYLFKR